jgi:tetratricopeptide (TPR) repeat protein
MKKLQLRAAARASPLELADRGAVALRLGRFKEAAEIFKQLARQDPQPEWADRLADAYAGRAHALVDKGMFKEAAMVLENTLAADGTLREPVLYLTCLIRQSQHQKARQSALRFIERLPAVEAGRVAGTGSGFDARRPGADRGTGGQPASWRRPRRTGSCGAGHPYGMAARRAVRRRRFPAQQNSPAIAVWAAAPDPEEPDPEEPDHACGRCAQSPQPADHGPGRVDVHCCPRGGGGIAR